MLGLEQTLSQYHVYVARRCLYTEMSEPVEVLEARPGPSTPPREDERPRPKDPPILFKDIDGVAEYESLVKGLEGVELTEDERRSLDELQQYLVAGEGSWVLGDDFLAFVGRVLSDSSLPSPARVSLLRCLCCAALREDVSLVLHQDRRHHSLLSYSYNIDRLPVDEQLALLLFMVNLFSGPSSSEWLLYISEWSSGGGPPLSNIRVTTKVCVHGVLAAEPALRDAGTALLYNIATKEVFDEVCVELCMAALQLCSSAPAEELLWRALAALARLAEHSHDVPQLVALVGPDPGAFRYTHTHTHTHTPSPLVYSTVPDAAFCAGGPVLEWTSRWTSSYRGWRRGGRGRGRARRRGDLYIEEGEGVTCSGHEHRTRDTHGDMTRTEHLEEEELQVEGRRGGRGLEQLVPAARWARRYSRTAAVADLVAGLTLGLTLVPQSIAYAALADMPVHYGLYSALVGSLVYPLLGTVRQVSIGPTSLSCLMTLSATRGLCPDAAVLLSFLAGCVVLAMGLLRLGFLVDLISPSVTSGFTTATAIIIVCSQLKGLLGLRFTAESPADNLALILQQWRLVRVNDLALAAACCTALLILRKLKDLPVSPKKPKLKKVLWLVSIARNALVVLAASTVAYYTYDQQQPLFLLSGKVEPGLPKLGLPPFSTRIGNETLGFVELTRRLGHHVLLLPFIMVMANIAIAKAFAAGARVDATQEMLSLGVCNLVSSLVRGLPSCGAFTRSAVSQASGVRTPAAGLYSGAVTLLSLVYLTEYFSFIPRACLSSVLICAVVFMIDVSAVSRAWRSCRWEAVVVVVTCVCCVWAGVGGAVAGGALCSAASLLWSACPGPLVCRRGSWLLVRPRRSLVFVNAERAADVVRSSLSSCPPLRRVLFDCGSLVLLDYTARGVLERLISELESSGCEVVFYNANREVEADLRLVAGLDPSWLLVTSPPPETRDEGGALLGEAEV
ncbi:unnamed protein product [Danaus chrysippus]|uniref:(African queen) hypothetical protein n=1 Tax=Danaus chrysippus TaxID=151541 RepID=A0A8J2WDC8_9NEOP|nr:unnamed protein product [Danaus chrysippus]